MKFFYISFVLSILCASQRTFAQCNPVDLALGHPAVASSFEDPIAYPASNAFDADTTNTRWSSQFSDPQWIYVDLGAQFQLCQVTLYWETADGKNFNIDISNDATNWTTVQSITNNGTQNDMIPITGTARYVRMYGITRATGYGYSLYAMKVYGQPIGGATTNLALGQPAVGTNTLGGFPPSQAFDGSNTSFWYSQAGNAGSLYVDLGTSQIIGSVSMLWDVDYAKNYTIDLSDDASTWNTVTTVNNNTAMNMTVNAVGTGRYVRFSGVTSAVGNGYGVAEMSVTGPIVPLPVKLINFTATRQNTQQVLLQWTTAIETNSKQFNIERSTDGVHYTVIGQVTAAGNSTTTLQYQWVDNAPANGNNDYRLQQIDLDGQSVYSNIAVVNMGGTGINSLSVYPNPVQDRINIQNPNGALIKSISIYTSSGVQIKNMEPGSVGNITIPAGNWSSGLYILKVLTDKGVEVLKISK